MTPTRFSPENIQSPCHNLQGPEWHTLPYLSVHAKHASTSGALHSPFPQPGMLFPQIFDGTLPSFLQVSAWMLPYQGVFPDHLLYNPPTPILLPCPTSCFYTMTAILNNYWFTVYFSQLECQLCEGRDLKLCCSGLCLRCLEQLLAHSRCSVNTCNIWGAETAVQTFRMTESNCTAILERHLEVCIQDLTNVAIPYLTQ